MKLVELLAKEVGEWPNGCDWAVSIKGEKGFLASFGYGNLPKPDPYDKSNHTWTTMKSDSPIKWAIVSRDLSIEPSDRLESIVNEAQWQAERDRQKGGEWKRHRGGKQPVSDEVRVEVKLRDGDIQEAEASAFLWYHSDCDVCANIMQYRVISQQQAEEVKLSRLEARMLFSEPCIVYPESTEAKTDQIDGPVRWRNCVNELDAYIEEFTRERDELIERLASEGFALIPPVVSVMSEFSGVDMSDWRNLKVGDIIQCGTDGGWASSFEGVLVTVKDIERVDYTGGLPINGVDDNGDDDWGESYTFIRRP